LPTSPVTDGFLLILGIPNDTSNNGNGGTFFSSNPITSGNGTFASTDYFGGTWSTTSPTAGFAGLITTGGDAYVAANLTTDGGASESFTNWSQWDSSVNGITATNFGIYVFEIDASLDSKASVGVTFSSLPQGTFVIGYGEDSKHIYDTPFTESGLTTSGDGPGPFVGTAPAPPSVVLLAFGGLGLALIIACSRRRVLLSA
jgi:hypothetical protein